MQEDELLFKRTDEDPMIVVIASTNLTQSTADNIIVLNENTLESE